MADATATRIPKEGMVPNGQGQAGSRKNLVFEPFFNTRPSQANGLASLAPLRGNSSSHWKNVSQASHHEE